MEVDANKVEVEALIEDITHKTEIATKESNEAGVMKAQLDIDNVEITKQKEEANVILE